MPQQPTIKTRTYPAKAALQLVSEGVNPLHARLYAARGITTKTELNDELAGLIPPSELHNANLAARILTECIVTDRHVCIAGDFDCDGASSVSVAIRALRMMGLKRLSTAIPRREVEGYGLTKQLVQKIHQQYKPDLIVTVDCGISSYEGIEEATRLNIKTVVTDHHLCADNKPLPAALCIVNPNQPDCSFPSKNLCGCGVIFYVMLALRAHLRSLDYFKQTNTPEPNLSSLLDIVALATIGDVVKLDANNRRLVSSGLRRIRENKANEGIKALLSVLGKQPEKVTAIDLAFNLVSRINAAGRLEDASLGVQCLTTDDPVLAKQYAQELDDLNKERRNIEADMKELAEVSLQEIDVADRYSICLFEKSFHIGVIGIVSSRVKDRYNRPTIVFGRGGDGILKGSGRSIPALHLRDALDLVHKRNPELIISFGGHAGACGCAIYEENIGEFTETFEAVVRELLSEADLAQYIETDGGIDNEHMNVETAEELNGQVWGQGFPVPQFDDEFEVVEQRILKEKHTKLKLSKDGVCYDGIWFFHNEPVPARARVVYSLSINEFRGNKTVQLMVRHAENA